MPQGEDFGLLPTTRKNSNLAYLLEVFINDYIPLAIPTSREQLVHITNVIMTDMHGVFPADSNDEEDTLSLKKIKKLEAILASRLMEWRRLFGLMHQSGMCCSLCSQCKVEVPTKAMRESRLHNFIL